MVEIKLPLYADDMMIYTENPKESIKKKKLLDISSEIIKYSDISTQNSVLLCRRNRYMKTKIKCTILFVIVQVKTNT